MGFLTDLKKGNVLPYQKYIFNFARPFDPYFNSTHEKLKLIANALKSEQCPEYLTIDLTPSWIGDEGITYFSEALKTGQCSQGLTLMLGGVAFNDDCAFHLSEALKSGQCPNELGLVICQTANSDVGLKYIADALATGQCPQALKLDFGESYSMTDEGAKHFAEALMSGKCPQGFELSLRSCHITDQGAEYLAEALMSGKCLQGFKLDVLFNKITDVGASYFARALSSKKCPQGLGLTLMPHNDITNQGLEVLERTLIPGELPFGFSIKLLGRRSDESAFGLRVKSFPFWNNRRHISQLNEIALTLFQGVINRSLRLNIDVVRYMIDAFLTPYGFNNTEVAPTILRQLNDIYITGEERAVENRPESKSYCSLL